MVEGIANRDGNLKKKTIRERNSMRFWCDSSIGGLLKLVCLEEH